MPAIPALSGWRQEFKAVLGYREFEASLSYMRPCVKEKKRKGKGRKGKEREEERRGERQIHRNTERIYQI